MLRRSALAAFVAVTLSGCGTSVTTRQPGPQADTLPQRAQDSLRREPLILPSGLRHPSYAPRRWERGRPWRPRRNFGPFERGSHFEQIQIVLDTRQRGAQFEASASWYYNEYFNTFDPSDEDEGSAEIYRLYYRTDFTQPPTNIQLPTTATPQIAVTPGRRPAQRASMAAWVNRIVMSLDRVSYSSRFGGSVALRFSMEPVATGETDPATGSEIVGSETFEYEFGMGDRLAFDVQDLVMTIYVNPEMSIINAIQNVMTPVLAHVVFESGQTTAYQGGLIVPLTNDTLATFSAILDSIAVQTARALVPDRFYPSRPGYDLVRFVHGFVHNQHSGKIESNDRVISLEISDDWGDVTTADYRPFIVLSWKFLEVNTEDEEDAEYTIRLRADHEYEDVEPIPDVVDRRFELAEGHDSPLFTLGQFAIPDCQTLDTVRVRYRVVEMDPIDDDEYDRKSHRLVLNCGNITSQSTQQYFVGPVPNGVWLRHHIRGLDCYGVEPPGSCPYMSSDNTQVHMKDYLTQDGRQPDSEHIGGEGWTSETTYFVRWMSSVRLVAR